MWRLWSGLAYSKNPRPGTYNPTPVPSKLLSCDYYFEAARVPDSYLRISPSFSLSLSVCVRVRACVAYPVHTTQ